jgi:hypothetical protein
VNMPEGNGEAPQVELTEQLLRTATWFTGINQASRPNDLTKFHATCPAAADRPGFS